MVVIPEGPVNAATVLERQLARLPESILHAVHRRSEQAERRGREVLRLHVGEPAFRASAAVQAAMAEAVAAGLTSYTSAEGMPELRERLADRLKQANGISAEPDRILVTPGSSHAIAIILLAVCSPGDEVLIPEVYWPIYAQAAAIARVRVRTYPLADGHQVEPERIFAAASATTRLVVVNSPSNPTGALCTPSSLAAIAEWARRRQLWLIGDEAYEHFVYDDGPHVALASMERDIEPDERRVFSVHTFSKGYGMTGYRMGYVAAPTDTASAALRRVSEGTIIAPSTPVQYAALAALDDTETPRTAHEHVLDTRNAALTGAVRAGLLDRLPPAGWYAMVDVSGTGCSSVDFADRLFAEQAVAVTPGTAFVLPDAPDPHRVRVAFCGDRDRTVEGMRRLVRFATDLRTSFGDGSRG